MRKEKWVHEWVVVTGERKQLTVKWNKFWKVLHGGRGGEGENWSMPGLSVWTGKMFWGELEPEGAGEKNGQKGSRAAVPPLKKNNK